MNKINILINDQKFTAALNNTETAQEIYKLLPLESNGNFWGFEIYFEIPVARPNENPTEELEVGDLAYWPDGNCFCLFYGPTPASFDDRPKPASPVTVIGKINGDLETLKKLQRAKVKITKDENKQG